LQVFLREVIMSNEIDCPIAEAARHHLLTLAGWVRAQVKL
jgi:hypothetical protein